jgi:hypothetical protein
MNHNITSVLSELEALLKVCINQSDRHELDEIRISTTRAKELHRNILIARKSFQHPPQSKPTHYVPFR